MRILVLTALRPPAARFGTELVAHDLARRWAEEGHDVVIAGHVAEGLDLTSLKEGEVYIEALPPLQIDTRWTHYSRRSDGAAELSELLARLKPQIAIIVGFGPGAVTLTHLDTLIAAGCPTTLWHHVPGITCQQHGLREKNRQACDGRVEVRRCATCRLTAAGVPEIVAEIATRAPSIPGGWKLPSGLGHLVGGKALSAVFAAGVGSLAKSISHTFVGASWVQDVLVRNGFPEDRTSIVRPGLRRELKEKIASNNRNTIKLPLKLAYWGRIDDTKGIDTAIMAVRSLNVPLTFDIAGDFNASRQYDKHLVALRGRDERIQFVGRLDTASLAEFLRQKHVAVIPSSWPETGPLTVFEARAAGLPILGARTGGIAEICDRDTSARLFERGDYVALANLISNLAIDPTEVAKRRAQIPATRSMDDAADEIYLVFTQILEKIASRHR